MDFTKIKSIIYPEDRQLFDRETATIRIRSSIWRLKCHQIVNTDSSKLRWIRATDKKYLQTARLYDGQIRIIVAYLDITEQKQAADILQTSERKFRSIFDNISNVILILDTDIRFIEVNYSHCRVSYPRPAVQESLAGLN